MTDIDEDYYLNVWDLMESDIELLPRPTPKILSIETELWSPITWI